MTGSEWGTLVTAVGPVGALIIGVVWVLFRSGFMSRDDPSRSDVMTKLDKLDDKLDGIRDRVTGVEASTRELSRRVDRIDR